MDHFLEAGMALLWAKFGSEFAGYPLISPRFSSYKITHYMYHSKEYYFEKYVGEIANKNVNQEFQFAETTYHRGDIILECRWLSSSYLELKHHFGFRERKYNLEFLDGGKEMVIYDENHAIEGRAFGHRTIELSYVIWQDYLGKDLGFRIEPF